MVRRPYLLGSREAAERLVVALDVTSMEEARAWVERLWPEVRFFKVGLGLFTAAGPAAVHFIKERGGRVFLDLKYHDIPNTVAQAVASAAALGADLLTVHVAGGRSMLERAVQAAEEAAARHRQARPKIVGVTVLTSLDARALEEIGEALPLSDLALKRAQLAKAAGLDGVVCSPLEARTVKLAGGPRFLAVTPGIRPAGAELGDQARAASPEMALQCGADLLVVGRPILEAPDPLAAARRILSQMEAAMKEREGGAGRAAAGRDDAAPGAERGKERGGA
ncbi:MAG: orotidine-5'-phosphate decarboxylase [Firmicutes bacterium]|nr:orotidine-5'-phosphate decarboxylase [Bacillota bacterium]